MCPGIRNYGCPCHKVSAHFACPFCRKIYRVVLVTDIHQHKNGIIFKALLECEYVIVRIGCNLTFADSRYPVVVVEESGVFLVEFLAVLPIHRHISEEIDSAWISHFLRAIYKSTAV